MARCVSQAPALASSGIFVETWHVRWRYIPRRARRPENAVLRILLWRLIQQPCRNQHVVAPAHLMRHTRTALRAKPDCEPLGAWQVVALDRRLTGLPPELGRRNKRIGRVRAARRLLAARAVAIPKCRKRRRNFECDTTTQTTAGEQSGRHEKSLKKLFKNKCLYQFLFIQLRAFVRGAIVPRRNPRENGALDPAAAQPSIPL